MPRNPMSTDMRDEADLKRCVPTPQWTGARSMAVGTWRRDFLMAMKIQQMGIRLMAVGAQLLGDNLGTEVMHSYLRKATKMQRTGIKLMAIGT